MERLRNAQDEGVVNVKVQHNRIIAKMNDGTTKTVFNVCGSSIEDMFKTPKMDFLPDFAAQAEELDKKQTDRYQAANGERIARNIEQLTQSGRDSHRRSSGARTSNERRSEERTRDTEDLRMNTDDLEEEMSQGDQASEEDVVNGQGGAQVRGEEEALTDWGVEMGNEVW